MAQLRDIKNRIESVKKTKKITQAMKMVAAAKFKRASEQSVKAKPYLVALDDILVDLAKRIEPDLIPNLMKPNKATKQAAIIITADRGLCGGFNSTITKFVEKYLSNESEDVDLFIVGNKGYQYFKSRGTTIKGHTPSVSDRPSTDKAHDIINPLIEKFNDGTYEKIWVFYNEFTSSISGDVIKKQLLPVSFAPTDEESSKQCLSDYIYDPDKIETLDSLLSEYVTYYLHKAFLESTAAEEGARMAAMDSATDNASDVIQDLTLVYNRQRQAQITSEISEIVAGSEMLI